MSALSHFAHAGHVFTWSGGESRWDFWARRTMPRLLTFAMSRWYCFYISLKISPSISLPLAQASLTSERVWLQAFTFSHTLVVPFLKKCLIQNRTVLNTRGAGQPCLFVFGCFFLYIHYRNIYNSCFRTNWFLSLLGCQRETKRSLVLIFVLFYMENLTVPLPSATMGMVKPADFFLSFFFTLTSIHGLKVVEGNRKVDV